jgi:hypothetical protein
MLTIILNKYVCIIVLSYKQPSKDTVNKYRLF